MGYVKTTKEVEALQDVLGAPQARDGRMLFIPFQTDEAFVSSVLPPGLESNGTAASLTVGEWQGSNAGPYRAAFLMVSAKTEHTPKPTESNPDPKHVVLNGTYCLSFFISDDSAILFGRPMMGEPKKLANIEFSLAGSDLTASVTRFGTKLIDVTATIGAALPQVPKPPPTLAFWYKHQPNLDGQGLQYDPVLLMQENSQTPTKMAGASAEMSLQGTAHDPLGDVPVQAIGSPIYIEGDIHAECSVVNRKIDREDFLPYAFAAYDDWTVLVKENS